jgi:hypothetical protein
MEFAGLWKIDGVNETLKITEAAAADQYIFEYSGKDKPNERVQIFISTKKYALLARSKVYGRADIFIVDTDTFLIDDQKFTRVDNILTTGQTPLALFDQNLLPVAFYLSPFCFLLSPQKRTFANFTKRYYAKNTYLRRIKYQSFRRNGYIMRLGAKITRPGRDDVY